MFGDFAMSELKKMTDNELLSEYLYITDKKRKLRTFEEKKKKEEIVNEVLRRINKTKSKNK